MANKVQTVRRSADAATVREQLGLLADLAGIWDGHGFNLIARPDFHDGANLYLQLNQTHEHLTIDPIGSPIPNRGFGQDDIELFGLSYLQKIHDASSGGALHFEPGLWITQPPTTFPPEPIVGGTQIVARMGTIPHGNSLLAQGVAEQFTGEPTLSLPPATYAFSRFPSFNSTPFPTPPTAATPTPILNAAESSEKLTAAAAGVPPFTQYDLTIPDSAANPRTPFGTTEPPLPATINGVEMQAVINDPIALLQQVIKQQVAKGHKFKGVAINIATQVPITFFNNRNSAPGGPTTAVSVPDAGGGIENIPFLLGNQTPAPPQANAQTALVYATFWIEKVTHPNEAPFDQLQYAQMVILNFPILKALPKVVDIGWPHVSVATLRRTFG
jgi:hypothetical protein